MICLNCGNKKIYTRLVSVYGGEKLLESICEACFHTWSKKEPGTLKLAQWTFDGEQLEKKFEQEAKKF